MVYSPMAIGISCLGPSLSAVPASDSTTREVLQLAEDRLSLASHWARQGQIQQAVSQYQNILAQIPGSLPGATQLVKRIHEHLEILGGSGGSPGARGEALADQFLDQLFDPVNLAAFGVAAGVRSGTRCGVLAWLGREGATVSQHLSLGRRILPGALAFMAEVPAFVVTRRILSLPTEAPWGPELLGTGLFLGSLQLSHILSRPLRYLISPQSSLGNALPVLAQFAGIHTGLYLEHVSLGQEDPGWVHRTVDSIAILLQLQALGRLAGTLTPSLGFGNSPRQNFSENHFSEPVFSFENNRTHPRAIRPNSVLPSGGRERLGPLILLNQGQARGSDLEIYHERLRATPYGEAVGKNIAAIESGEPFFSSRWLDVLSSQQSRGSYSQLLDTDVLALLYRDHPSSTSLGDWQGARMQSFIREALRDSDYHRGREALFMLHGAMQAGLSSVKIDHLAAMFRYDLIGSPRIDARDFGSFIHQNRPLIGSLHRALGTQHANLVTQYIFQEAGHDRTRARTMMEIFLEGKLSARQPEGLLERAIDGASQHSLQDVALRRIFLTLATNGLPAKLVEIGRPGSGKNSFALVDRWARQGVPVEAIADRINGTEHIGYIDDGAVALKMAEVLLETGPYLAERSVWRDQNYQRLYQWITRRIASGRPIKGDTLMEWLAMEDHPQIQNLTRDWLTGDFEIALLEPADFDARVSEWGQVESCPYMFFDNDFASGKSRLVMRQLPRFTSGPSGALDADILDISHPAGMDAARLAVLQRLYGTIHEYQHFLDLNAESGPLLATRHNRVATEMLAFLEEFRWRARNTDVVMFEYARRQGISLGTYLRNRAERNYFTQYDQQVAAKFFPGE